MNEWMDLSTKYIKNSRINEEETNKNKHIKPSLLQTDKRYNVSFF